MGMNIPMKKLRVGLRVNFDFFILSLELIVIDFLSSVKLLGQKCPRVHDVDDPSFDLLIRSKTSDTPNQLFEVTLPRCSQDNSIHANNRDADCVIVICTDDNTRMLSSIRDLLRLGPAHKMFNFGCIDVQVH